MRAPTQPGGYVHSAFFYRGDREYVDTVVGFVTAGLRNDDAVLVAAPTENLARLRDGLADVASKITFVDMAVAGRNPRRMLAMESAFLAEHPGRRARMVGETTWPERFGDAYPGCVTHEALINTAFADRNVMGLCPYDAERLPERVLADALATHPLTWRDGASETNAGYAPDEALARYNSPLPGDPAAVSCLVREPTDLSSARSFVAGHAQRLGLAADRIADLQLIATELATNSLQHTASRCRLALWRRDGYLVCEASDGGRLDDPLAGCRLPPAGAASGHGLLLVNALADLVRTHTAPTGTTIQAYVTCGAGTAG